MFNLFCEKRAFNRKQCKPCPMACKACPMACKACPIRKIEIAIIPNKQKN